MKPDDLSWLTIVIDVQYGGDSPILSDGSMIPIPKEYRIDGKWPLEAEWLVLI